MVRSEAKLFRTKTLHNFPLNPLSNSFFPKNTFSVWIFVLNCTSPIFLAKRTRWHDMGQKCPRVKFRHPKNDVFGWNFLMKVAPYLFSGPNWLYAAFGAKLFRTKTLLNFTSKALSNSFFPNNMFSVWIFVQNRTTPIFLAKRTKWHDRGQKCPGVKLRAS